MTFPQTPLPVVVELGNVEGAVWTDITDDVYLRDPIQISRGRSDESSQTAPQTCQLTLNNRHGKYSPRNPLGPYYGLLGRNTLLRVSSAAEGAVAPTFDASSTANGSGDLAWTHTPVDVPRGVVVTVVVDSGSPSLLPTAATYGGVTLTQIFSDAWNAGGGLVGGFAVYHRGSGLPAGPQTVAVDTPDGFPGARVASAVTVTGTFDTVATTSADNVGATANPANPFTATENSLILGVAASAHDDVTQIAGSGGTITISEHDFGTEVASFTRRVLPVTGVGSSTWSSAATNWAALSVLVSSLGTSVRFVGEVSEWPPRWDVSGKDAYVQIEAAGIMRRLGQGRPPVDSGFKTYVLALEPNNYWPLDEGELAGYGRNASPQSAFRFFPWPSSGPNKPTFKFGTGELTGLPNGLQITRTNTGGATFPYFRGDLAISPSDIIGIDFVFQAEDLGTIALFANDYIDNQWRLALRSVAGDDVEIAHVQRSTGVVTSLGDTGPLPELTDGLLHHCRFVYEQNGANVDLECFIDGISVLAVSRNATTMDGAAFCYFTYQPVGTETPLALGHVTVWRDVAPPDVTDLVLAMRGFAGETAGQRMDRVCAEQLIGLTMVGDPDATAPMGRQAQGDLLAQLRDAAAADLGSLYEPRDTLGVAYRTREATYNQGASLVIDYAAGELSPPLEPTDDDALTRNDVTATRRDGGAARQTLTAGRLSTAEPPAGVGPYPDEVTVNVELDDQLSDIAGWLLLNGTWDESRYPAVTVDRATPAVAANAALSAALLDLDIDDEIAITGMQAVNVYDIVRLLARGYRETLGAFSHTFEFNCTPAGPYGVGVWRSDVATDGSRYNPDAIRTWEDLTTTETGIEILIDAGDTDGGMFSDADAPFDLMIGGERMTVTSVDNEAISFVGVGTGDSDVNANVQAGLPAGTVAGDLVLLYVSIRNSPIGFPNGPGGWVEVLNMANARVWARLYDGSWTMPVISFSGGVAGADTIAQSAAFRGLSLGNFSSAQLNGSAQNIATPPVGESPAGVAIWCGWKQDDWTSIGLNTAPGATLINARLGQAGDDAGQVWNYKILAPGEGIPDGTFPVTGGAAAISRGGVILLWAGQTLTVTRSVNGVIKTHDAGAAVALFEPARYAL